MQRGKEICKMLKEIRRQIAAENEIEFVTSDCKHKGSCAGTCPKCEAEVVYLENQLAARRRLGKVVKLVGLSMGLASLAPVAFTACHPQDGDMQEPEVYVTEGDIVAPSSQVPEDGLKGDVAIAPGENL